MNKIKKYLRVIDRKLKDKITNTKNKITHIKNKIVKHFVKHFEDTLIFGGLFLIVKATFLINYIAGLYVLGFIFIALGIFFLKFF